ncbi:MAG: AraC family ligand binding domain-containing protein [Nodosilinea sp.]
MVQFTSPQERVKFWRDPALQGLDILRARYVTHSFSRHTHDGYAIGVIEAGVEAFAYRGETHQAQAGQLVIIHPGEVHTGQAGAPQGWAYRMLYPDVLLMQRAAQELGLTRSAEPYFPAAVIVDPWLAQRFRQLHLALEHADLRLERESRLLGLMTCLIERHSEAPPPATAPGPTSPGRDRLKPVRQVQDYVRQHYAENLSLDQLATLANLPPLKLLRQFRQLTGLPPHRYLVQVRVQQAQRLLGMGVAIADVATDTGFADQSHLNRHFKRLVGVTPGQYAQGCGGLP